MFDVKSHVIGDKRIDIWIDESPVSPRENDNAGQLILSHKRYNLPMEVEDFDPARFDFDLGAIEAELRATKDAAIVRTVYMLDHSGVAFSIDPFGDAWDSGIVGVVFVTKKEMEENGWDEEAALKCVRAELTEYTKYMNGRVFGYSIVKLKTCPCCKHVSEEREDSCGGFYDSESMVESVPDEFKEFVKGAF